MTILDDSPKLWAQFRRLLLGTAVELFRDAGVRIDPHALRLDFDPESLFHYPALRSQMRFVGTVCAELSAVPSAAALAEVSHMLEEVWPDIVELVHLPMIGAMSVTSNDVVVNVEGNRLTVSFSLAAD